MVASLYGSSFWAALAFTLIMALLPQPPQLPGNLSDKVQHVAAFAMLAALGSVAYPSAPVVRLLVGLSAFGALIELLQSLPELNRDSDPLDWVAGSVAAALVLALFHWWRSKQGNGNR